MFKTDVEVTSAHHHPMGGGGGGGLLIWELKTGYSFDYFITEFWLR